MEEQQIEISDEIRKTKDYMREQLQKLKELPEFKSFNDRYMPMILASSTASVIPQVRGGALAMAGIFTLVKSGSHNAYVAKNAIEAIAKTNFKLLKSRKEQIIFTRFVNSLLQEINEL